MKWNKDAETLAREIELRIVNTKGLMRKDKVWKRLGVVEKMGLLRTAMAELDYLESQIDRLEKLDGKAK